MTTAAAPSILVATDLSEASDEVVRSAGALAALTDSELHLLHAYRPAVLQGWEGSPPLVELPSQEKEVRGAMEVQIRRCLPGHMEIASLHAAVDTPVRAINDRAREVSADLIVLGPHRRRPAGDLNILGTTADRVIRTAEAPCLIARGPLALPLRRVLVPIDLSDPARDALHVAIAWSAAFGASDPSEGEPGVRLRVVHVIPENASSDDAALSKPNPETVLRTEIAQALERVGNPSNINVRDELVWGVAPADEILRLAGQGRNDLIVLGTHGHGLLLRALIGSVSSKVARAAPCSVLLVPPSRASAARPEPG